jgi:hypothetical protein
MSKWLLLAEEGELKVFVDGPDAPAPWWRFHNAQIQIADTRECPGTAVSLGATRAMELVQMKMRYNEEAEREKVVRPGGWREPIRGSLRIDRNAPCACGSGRKSKKCCGGGK